MFSRSLRTCYASAPRKIVELLTKEHSSAIERSVECAAPNPIKLTAMVEANELGGSSKALLLNQGIATRMEVLARIAHNLRTFENLPPNFVESRDFHWVHANTLQWFDLLQKTHITTQESHEEFVDRVRQFEAKDRQIVADLAAASAAFQAKRPSESEGREFDNFIHCFCSTRLGWRLLLLNHCSLAREGRSAFDRNCRPFCIAHDSCNRVRDICLDHCGIRPPFEIEGDDEATFCFIPAHLAYALTELLKNAMRATLETHYGEDEEGADLPPVRISIREDNKRVAITISDEGGGVPKHEEEIIWRFGWTTCRTPSGLIVPPPGTGPSGTHQHQSGTSSQPQEKQARSTGGSTDQRSNCSNGDEDCTTGIIQHYRVLGGWGCGLPLSRCYIEHFGGQLRMHSTPSYGTELFIELPKDGEEKILLTPPTLAPLPQSQ